MFTTEGRIDERSRVFIPIGVQETFGPPSLIWPRQKTQEERNWSKLLSWRPLWANWWISYLRERRDCTGRLYHSLLRRWSAAQVIVSRRRRCFLWIFQTRRGPRHLCIILCSNRKLKCHFSPNLQGYDRSRFEH